MVFNAWKKVFEQYAAMQADHYLTPLVCGSIFRGNWSNDQLVRVMCKARDAIALDRDLSVHIVNRDPVQL